MGLGRLVEAWNNYGIQMQVLMSLLLQLLLFFLPIVRRHKMLEKCVYLAKLCKLLLWLAYQLADTTAIYILGHMAISNSSSSLSGEVMALWASLLLVHLGGQDTMTAYSLEDNRLWKRHVLTLVVQAAGVLYVLPGYEGRGRSSGSYPNCLRVAAAMVFVVGFLKFVERVWVLRSSNLNKLFTRLEGLDSNERCGRRYELYTPSGQDSSERAEEDLELAHQLLYFCMCQFLDYKEVVISPFQRGGLYSPYLKSVINYYAREKRLCELVHLQLSLMHDLLYTKAAAIHTGCGFLLRVFSWLTMATTCTLVVLSGSSYGGRRLDAAVTNALLAGALLLETASSLKAAGSTWTYEILCFEGWGGLGRVVLAFRRLVRAAEWSRRRRLSYIGGRWSTEICGGLVWWSTFGGRNPDTSLVVDQIVEMVTEITKDNNKDKDEKEKLMNSRGGLSLDRLQLPSLKASLEQLEFDEYLVLWYYATEEFTRPVHATRLRSAVTDLSRYMMYLFKKQPHMLPPPVRQKTCPNLSEKDRIKKNSLYQNLMKELLVHDPQERERKLMPLLWMWIEMLCYAASHCNRESHARELSNGSPEFATVLWVLRAGLFNANN